MVCFCTKFVSPKMSQSDSWGRKWKHQRPLRKTSKKMTFYNFSYVFCVLTPWLLVQNPSATWVCSKKWWYVLRALSNCFAASLALSPPALFFTVWNNVWFLSKHKTFVILIQIKIKKNIGKNKTIGKFR